MNISYVPAADPVTTAEPAGPGRVTRFLGPGDRFGRSTLRAGHGGIEFCDGSILIGDLPALAALGQALVMHVDPPSFDDVEAAGLCGNGTDGTGPYTWHQVARAALTRMRTDPGATVDRGPIADSVCRGTELLAEHDDLP